MGLGEQVTSEDKSNIIRCKTGFSDRKNSGLFPLPGLLPEALPVFSVQRPLIHQK